MMNKVDVVSNGSGCDGGGAFTQLYLLFQGFWLAVPCSNQAY